MPTADTQLVDTDVVYCDDGDVFAYIRNKSYDDLPATRADLTNGGGLTQEDVDDAIKKASERADTYTKRAWRTRKVVDAELNIRLSHKQQHSRHRRRKIRGGGRRRHNFQVSQRAFVDLPHIHIKPIDSAEGDKVEILNPNSVNDVTADEGRDEGSYVVSNRKGVLRPDLELLTPVGTHLYGPTIDEGIVSARVSYRYGHPHSVTDYTTGGDTFGASTTYTVSTEVPPDVRDAVAMLVVARLIGSDQYGEVIPNTGDDSPNLSDAASSFKSDAMSTLKDYRRV